LNIGASREDDGKPVILDSVKQANKIILESGLDNEYLPSKEVPNSWVLLSN